MAQVTRADCTELKANPGYVLRDDAAKAWDRAAAAYGRAVPITGSWRSLEVQEAIFRDRYRPGNLAGRAGYTTDVRTWNGRAYTRRAGTAAAAVPGTSNHGGGIAVDVSTSVFASFNAPARLKWLAAAREHGWADDEGRSVSECWHMTYYPARDRHRGKTAAKVPGAAPTYNPGVATTKAKVTALQRGLNKLIEAKTISGTKLDADGIFGKATAGVVTTYQRKRKLEADGVPGKLTAAALAKDGVKL